MIRIPTRVRYGVRALAELAAAYPARSVTVKELAQKQRLSIKYLEQIMAVLKAVGLVSAARGRHGGYTLTSPPESINLRSVFQVLGGDPTFVECVANPQTCAMTGDCLTRDTWVELREAMQRILEGTTLRDLVERRGRSSRPFPAVYQI